MDTYKHQVRARAALLLRVAPDKLAQGLLLATERANGTSELHPSGGHLDPSEGVVPSLMWIRMVPLARVKREWGEEEKKDAKHCQIYTYSYVCQKWQLFEFEVAHVWFDE